MLPLGSTLQANALSTGSDDSSRGPEAKLFHVKFSDLHVSKEDSVKPWCYQLKCQLFETEDLADEDSRLMPADVSAIVHPSQQNAFRVIEFRQLAWQSHGAWLVETCWDLVVQGLMGTLIVEHISPSRTPAFWLGFAMLTSLTCRRPRAQSFPPCGR
jgi:hypothetical protein